MLKTIKRSTSILVWNEIVLAIVLIASVVLAVATVKLGGKVKEIRTIAAKQELEVNRLQSAHDEFLTLKSSVESIESQQSKLIALIPTRRGILDNIEGLEQVAGATGNEQNILILDVVPDPKKKSPQKPNPVSKIVTVPKSIQMVDYQIDLKGGFVNLMSYLKLFENQPFLTYVKQIRLTAETARTGPQNINVNTGGVNTRIEGTFFFVND